MKRQQMEQRIGEAVLALITGDGGFSSFQKFQSVIKPLNGTTTRRSRRLNVCVFFLESTV